MKRLHFDALVSLEELPPQATFIFEKIENMSTQEAVDVLKKAIVDHDNDVNMLDSVYELWENLVARDHKQETSLGEDSEDSEKRIHIHILLKKN